MRRDFDSGPAMKISLAFAEKTSFAGVAVNQTRHLRGEQFLPGAGRSR